MIDPVDELRELFESAQDEDGMLTADACKDIVRSMKGKFDKHHLEAMLVKIDNFWWGEKKKRGKIVLE